jgi:hypothetical protein
MRCCGLEWSALGQGQVDSSCECGNEYSGSIKQLAASRVVLCSIDLVSYPVSSLTSSKFSPRLLE